MTGERDVGKFPDLQNETKPVPNQVFCHTFPDCAKFLVCLSLPSHRLRDVGIIDTF